MADPPSPPSTKFRVIAREAVIFALIGMALALIAGVVWAVVGARSAAAIRLHAVDLRWTTDTSWFPEAPIEKRVKAPLTNGIVLFVADCAKVHEKEDNFDQAARQMAAQGSNKPLEFQNALPPGTISDDCVIFLDKFFASLGGANDRCATR